MWHKIIIGFLLVANIFTATFCFRLNNRLEQTRQQLEHYRTEFESAEDKQRELREIIRGTDEILSESFDTVAGIREQIKVIRESYEEMEALLYSSDSDSNRINNLDIKE